MKTFASLFTGFGGADIGAKMGGYNPIWGVEYDPLIAEVYKGNIGDHVAVADIRVVNPCDFDRPTVLHASPPCPNFSVAKKDGRETERDLDMAMAVATFIRVLKPEFFTLENVRAYEKSESWEIIFHTLQSCGYGVRWWILNSADFGVPQTRIRMIVIARRDGQIPQRPRPTHENTPSGLFSLPRWVSWYEAIEGLIPNLKERDFMPYQKRLLGDILLKSPILVDGANASPPIQYRANAPSFTITAMSTPSKHPHICNSRYGRKHLDKRCLARFQSFPDWYTLPDSNAIACRGIGNAVPPLLMSHVLMSL